VALTAGASSLRGPDEIAHLSHAGRGFAADDDGAAATGNLLLQAVASGRIGSLAEGRTLVTRAVRPRRFEPRERPGRTEAERYREIDGRYGRRA
jgi:hypothetical protein